ncbi:hypothetical protein [Runella sp.]|uniref:hypothetical protein n=1 Tax=Runella sp. TaxID=1960881 RepID=UPI003D125065
MKNNLFLLFLILAIAACKGTSDQTAASADSTATAADTSQIESSPNNFYCIPGLKAGSVKANSSEASLKELLGAENVIRDSVYIGEGFYEKGTTLFKGTPEEAQILWKDTINYAKPDNVLIRPAEGKPNQWLVEGGIKIGMTLIELEKINGKPFKIGGFGWDYGGFATDWQGGKLEDKNGIANMSLRFDYNSEDEKLAPFAEKVMGEGPFLSSNPAMQKLNPKIVEISIRFDE